VVPEIKFKLLLECALASGRTGIGKLSFHFIGKAIEVFEDKFPKEKEKYDGLKLIIGVLNAINSIPLDEYTKLVSKIVGHCNNMVNIELKIRLIAMSCNLFHAETADGLYDNKEDLVKYLKLSVNIVTKEELEKNLKESVLVELLDVYIFFIKKAALENKPTQLASVLIKMIKDSLSNEISPRYQHFNNTLTYIKRESRSNPILSEIELWKYTLKNR